MTPSQQAKQAGLESLAEMERISKVSKRTLINWHKHKPVTFGVLLAGCVAVKTGQSSKTDKW